MMRYTLGAAKTSVWGSKWLRTLVILTILAMGLLIYDVVEYGNLMTYVFTGIK